MAVDFSGSRRRGVDEQQERTGVAARRDLAKTIVWHPESGGESLCRANADGHRNLPAAEAKCIGICD